MIASEAKNKKHFKKAIEGDRVIVDWFANWCGPCRQLASVLEDASVPVVKVDVDENPELAQKYGIMSLPTLGLFEEGEELDRIVGATDKKSIQELYEA
jgi:thioredoxin 1